MMGGTPTLRCMSCNSKMLPKVYVEHEGEKETLRMQFCPMCGASL